MSASQFLPLLLLLMGGQGTGKPAIRDFDLKTLEMLGGTIFLRDAYAARATDILLAELGSMDAYQKEGILGWIVTDLDEQVVVRFVKQVEGTFQVVYDVTFPSPEKGVLNKASGALPPAHLNQFRARQQALTDLPAYCSDRYNTVVLPDVDGDGFLVYALAATTEPGKVMIGGHYRLTVSANGREIEQTDRLFNSCLSLEREKDQDGEIAAHVTSHVISPTPLEIHVFLNLMHGRPIYVVTTDGIIWKVYQGAITKEGTVEDMKKKSP